MPPFIRLGPPLPGQTSSMAEQVRNLQLQSWRLKKDLDDLIQRVRFTASARQAHDVEDLVRQVLGNSEDIVLRWVGLPEGGKALVVYISSLADDHRVEDFIIRPLASWRPANGPPTIEKLAQGGVLVGVAKPVVQGDQIIQAILHGDAVVALDGASGVLLVSVAGSESRPVEDPAVEVIARGPRDAFTETATINVALIRRRLADPNLRVHRYRSGSRSDTNVFLLYLDDVVNRTALQELQQRLNRIDIDAILDSSMLEHLIEDTWWSPFPQALRTERPDVVAAALLEGRSCLVVDNTPLVIVVPATLNSLFHSPEDMYARPAVVSILRLVRFIAAFFALTLPSLYVAVAAFNPELLPITLAIKIAYSREGVALPVVAEALLIQLFLEILREAGFRLPGPIGQTFGIVGGIVLGDLGVRSGLVSEMMVVVIALTALSSFSAPSLIVGTSIRLLGLPLLLLAATMGVYGVVIGLVAIIGHLVTLKSFGIPYLVPYPFYPSTDFKDIVIRAPVQAYQSRITVFGPQQRRRFKETRSEAYSHRSGWYHIAKNGDRS